nr:ring finger protein 113a [Hymenolepis microstoma]
MSSASPTCLFIKKRKKAATRVKEGSSSSDDDVKIVKKKEKIDSNPLVQKTAYFSVKRKTVSDEDSDDDLTNVTFKADYNAVTSGPKDQGATATLEIDTDVTQDAQALFIKSQKINKEVKSNNDKVYRGMNNYAQYLEKKDTVMGNAASGFNRKGPMRAPAHLRATVRWDYQPDVCKDYKETGFCSFGDSCKFLHDRSDYKHGWQLEQEFQEGVYGVEGNDNRYEIKSDEDEDDDQYLPLKCIMCRGDYKDPVVTNCKHYFCSACAIKRLKKTTRCYACTEDTKGVFKMARDLLSRIEAIKAKRKEKGLTEDSDAEDGDGGSADGEGGHDHRHHHNHSEPCCSHPHSHKPAANDHSEHYISSSELEDNSDKEEEKAKSPVTFPTLTRLEGAKPESVEDSTLKAAVRAGQLECHPDKCVHLSDGEQTERRGHFEALIRAWRVLECDESRKRYDAALRQARLLYSTSAPVHCTLDFSDLSSGEEEIDPEEVYTAPCRCGGEFILEGVAALARIPYAHCFQCSLVARVVYTSENTNKDC